jgi:hypothetical protein
MFVFPLLIAKPSEGVRLVSPAASNTAMACTATTSDAEPARLLKGNAQVDVHNVC